MSIEEDLSKAYLILGIESGTEWEAVLARYKTCARVWHPDKAPDDPVRQQEATDELKRLNWARDVLKAHFKEGSHSEKGYCACRKKTKEQPEPPPVGPASESTSSPSSEPPDFSSFTQGGTQSEDSEKSGADNSRIQEGVYQSKLLQDQGLRWKVATALGIAYVSLCLFGITANSAKNTWSEWAKSWQKKEVPKASEPAPVQPSQPPAYVPAYNRFPGGNSSSWQSQQSDDRRRREEAAQKKREQDLYFAKLEVDKYETAIAFNNKEITQIDIKLADSLLAETTRRQLMDIREYRVKGLGEARSFLKAAQEKVAAIDPSYVPAQPPASFSPPTNLFNTHSDNSMPFKSTSSSSSLHNRLKERKLFP